MKSLYNFIVKPYGERYNNTIKLNKKELIVNTNIEHHQFINKKAIVVSTPIAFKSPIKKGDTVYVHHNLLHQIAEVNKDVEETKIELEKEYGAVNINLEDGTYTPIEVPEEVANV